MTERREPHPELREVEDQLEGVASAEKKAAALLKRLFTAARAIHRSVDRELGKPVELQNPARLASLHERARAIDEVEGGVYQILNEASAKLDQLRDRWLDLTEPKSED